ncbi:hypothetical protein EDD11_003890 [Mortierella claussenii]|nr:hypothetical protein EDD11_003890 [Mortierella claussenii]
MVTTRSRGNKQAAAAVTSDHASNGTTPTAATATTGVQQLKRKGSGATPVQPAAKLAKTELADDLNAEAKLPPAPAPTPVTPHKQPAATDSSHVTATGAAAPSGEQQPVGALPTATAPAVPVPAPVVIPPVAFAPTTSTTAALENLKEPAPEEASLPEVATVLSTQPAPTTDILATAPLAASMAGPTPTDAGPTAPAVPQLTTAPAVPTSMATNPLATTTVPTPAPASIAFSQEPTLHVPAPIGTVAVDSASNNSGNSHIDTGLTANTTQAAAPVAPMAGQIPLPQHQQQEQQQQQPAVSKLFSNNGGVGIETATPTDPAAPAPAANGRQSNAEHQTVNPTATTFSTLA